MYKICLKDHEKYFETNADIYMALLQIRSTLISLRLPSIAKFLLERLIRDIVANSVDNWFHVIMMRMTLM